MNFFLNKKKDREDGSFIIEQESAQAKPIVSGENPAGALTPEEIVDFSCAPNTENGDALALLQQRMLQAQKEKTETLHALQSPEPISAQPQKERKESQPISENPTVSEKKTLLEKCRPFILDENGQDETAVSEPVYQLESVAEILKNNSEETVQKLSKKYEIFFDDLSKFSSRSKIKPQETEVTPKIEIPSVSDLTKTPDSETEVVPSEHTATIRFTPVTDSGNTSHIRISTQTRNIDLTGELSKFSHDLAKEEPPISLQKTEFDDYRPKEEFSSPQTSKHFLRLFSLQKRNRFLSAAFSLLFALVLATLELPFLSELILSHTRAVMWVCTVLLAADIAVNWDMFRCIPKAFNRHSQADLAAVTASLFTLIYAGFGAAQGEIVLNMVLLVSFLLSVRAVFAFLKACTQLSNFKHISSPAPKRAVKLIEDSAVTFAMANDAIDGDVLIAAPQKADHIDGYMKYTGFGTFLGGRMPFITVFSLLLSAVIGGAAAAYFHSAFSGLYAATVIQSLSCAPTLFFVETLPLYSAAKKCGKVGAMIAGKTGAQETANANAMVLHATDLFPSGTVTLHQMKPLSDNDIDDTLIRAASLTEMIDSPLAAVFKRIVGAGHGVLPKSDTVKYEEKMGISGWVDDRLLFVGNRTLLESHGIQTPNLEIDRTLLRNGFFPVYVATADHACALLAVQYTVAPEIAHELQRLSTLGVTLLIYSTDPNLTEEMICDYMGLYSDSVKVMNNAGCHMYQNAVTHSQSVAAPAAYKGNPMGLAAIVNAANRIGKADGLLTVLYVLIAVLGTVLFTYISFNGQDSLVGSSTVLMYQLACTVISYILYLIERP